MIMAEHARLDAAAHGNLVVSVVRFCRLLRQWGVPVAAGASQTAIEALREIGLARREDFRHALALTLVRRPEDMPLFLYLFNAFWGTATQRAPGMLGEEDGARPAHLSGLDRRGASDSAATCRDGDPDHLESAPGIAELELDDVLASRAALTGRPYGRMLAATAWPERAELQRLALTLSQVLATRPSRRRIRDAAGNIPDPRGMLRDSLRYGGIPVEFRWKRRRIARTRLLLFCDVSRSMDEYAAFFLRFAAAVLRRMWRIEVFLFANDVVRVSDRWAEQAWGDLQAGMPDCGGGTQIGKSLSRFLDAYDTSLLGSGTIVMILSDGLDTGDTNLIDRAMERLRRRARAIVWLNPLLHLEGYEPRAAGMAAALKHVDVFAPVHDLPSMWDLVGTIRALATRPRGGFQPHGLDRRSGMAPEPQMSVTSSGSDVAPRRDVPPERREGT
jgi:uncharacterized protein with von Willebrand factor type A (vWA) domain